MNMQQIGVKNRNLAYTVLLVGFAAVMVGLLIVNGPPFQTNVVNSTPPANDRPLLGADQTPADIRWYGVANRTTGQSGALERTTAGGWQRVGAPDEVVDAEGAAYGAFVIYNFRLSEVVKYDAETDLSPFGLAPQPQVVVSFGIISYNEIENRDEVQDVTLYIGARNPTQQAYYAVFVDEARGVRRGEWVYLIQTDYIDALLDLLANDFQIPTASPQESVSATPSP
jgi:hypothetical protein